MGDTRYEEVGRNFRFYHGVRYALLVAYLIGFYAVICLTFWFYVEITVLAYLVPTVFWPVGLLVWIIELRTRELHQVAIVAGKALEGKRGGFFTRITRASRSKDISRFKQLSQSTVAHWLYIGSSAWLLFLGFFLYCYTRGWIFPSWGLF